MTIEGGKPKKGSAAAVDTENWPNLPEPQLPSTCLLYTSDAADERSSVDLGGRRIIKKKKNRERCDIGRRKTTEFMNET